MKNKDYGFLTQSVMQGGDWRALELSVTRLISHAGWRNVLHIGESGDKGGDVLAVRYSPDKKKDEAYLFQVKATSSGKYVGVSAVDEAIQGQAYYNAKVVVVVTNGDFTKSTYKRRDELNEYGHNIKLWNGKFLIDLISRVKEYSHEYRELRDYQKVILDKVMKSFIMDSQKAMFVLATGLGKTMIAASLADELYKKGLSKTLVLCHSIDLAQQLQQAFWAQTSKHVQTRLFYDGEAPIPVNGINFGLYQSLHSNLGGLDRDAFDLIIVDEAHHALANAFLSCINHLKPKYLLGMTATPWRGDGVSLDSVFGKPIAQVSLIEGMRMGYLSRVEYKLMCDNIDWARISALSRNSLTVRDLNKNLFLPQRDEAVISKIIYYANRIPNPKIAIFTSSIEHASAFAHQLTDAGISTANLSISDKVKRRRTLMDFAVGSLMAVTAVDVLNEGIDVPDVNILVFLRATHSRRIFIQQLGRGLRITKGKEKVIVLDFVTDIRRIAAVKELDDEARARSKPDAKERIIFKDGVVTFSNDKMQSFIEAWLDDVTSLQDKNDAEKLVFPNFEVDE